MKCKVKACIKSPGMVVEFETSSSEKKHIKIMQNFGGYFVNTNKVGMSYQQNVTCYHYVTKML